MKKYYLSILFSLGLYVNIYSQNNEDYVQTIYVNDIPQKVPAGKIWITNTYVGEGQYWEGMSKKCTPADNIKIINININSKPYEINYNNCGKNHITIKDNIIIYLFEEEVFQPGTIINTNCDKWYLVVCEYKK